MLLFFVSRAAQLRLYAASLLLFYYVFYLCCCMMYLMLISLILASQVPSVRVSFYLYYNNITRFNSDYTNSPHSFVLYYIYDIFY